ncbi:vanW-like family protein, partial [Clostridium botulinum CFSAN001627]
GCYCRLWNIDYKFRNNLQSPIYIEAYTSNGNVVFNLYSK